MPYMEYLALPGQVTEDSGEESDGKGHDDQGTTDAQAAELAQVVLRSAVWGGPTTSTQDQNHAITDSLARVMMASMTH